MTRKEAVKILKSVKPWESIITDEAAIAIDMAIKALEQEPCDDAVSRKAVEYLLAYFIDKDKYSDAVYDLRKLPSVIPTVFECEDGDELDGYEIYECENRKIKIKL